MVQRYDDVGYGVFDMGPDPEGAWVKYEDYVALKWHADAMCAAMRGYDLGERVSFQCYQDYIEWCLDDN